jgi:hypothetical protein
MVHPLMDGIDIEIRVSYTPAKREIPIVTLPQINNNRSHFSLFQSVIHIYLPLYRFIKKIKFIFSSNNLLSSDKNVSFALYKYTTATFDYKTKSFNSITKTFICTTKTYSYSLFNKEKNFFQDER